MGCWRWDRAKASLVWWCVRLSVCSDLVIRQGAVKARLFLVHRHCASLGTNEPELASLACNCHSADDAIRHDSARCDVAVTCELACQRYCFAFTPRPFFHRLRNQALMSSAARNQTNTPVIRLYLSRAAAD